MNKAETINVENACGNIALHDVSKFYGDILGVNRINLEIALLRTGMQRSIPAVICAC